MIYGVRLSVTLKNINKDVRWKQIRRNILSFIVIRSFASL